MTRTHRLLAFAALALACADPATEGDSQGSESDSGSEESSCVIGSEGCVCTPGGGCDPGLACDGGVCLPVAGEEDTAACTGVGCPCGDVVDCDPGLLCKGGLCQLDVCGNGALDGNELCDDGNGVDGDGCDNDCTRTEIIGITAGAAHTCALIEGGRLRCWGHNIGGQIGYGLLEDIGDNETPAQVGDLPLPPAVEIDGGGAHTCARFEDGGIRCWGVNTLGQLGYASAATVFAIGDDETLDDLEPVSLGAPADELATGLLQSCVRASGQLRCWGAGSYGQLGTGSTAAIGDDELPSTVAPMVLGGEPLRFALGGAHGCAVVVGGGLRCWGHNDRGQLGYGNTLDIGDDEAPADAGEVSVLPASVPRGTTITGLALGLAHSCALLSSGDVLCWGNNTSGQLGQGSVQSWGGLPGESPSSLPPISLGAPAVAIAAGYEHTCALLDNGRVRCWGFNSSGQLGLGHSDTIGDDELPGTIDPIELGASVIRLAAGAAHTCAVLDDQGVICWGDNEYGQLGYGFTHDIGDNEIPEVAGAIDLL